MEDATLPESSTPVAMESAIRAPTEARQTNDVAPLQSPSRTQGLSTIVIETITGAAAASDQPTTSNAGKYGTLTWGTC
jgi:hypothetical protein